MVRRIVWFGLLLAGVFSSEVNLVFADSYELSEPINDTRTFRVETQIDGQGTLKTPSKEATPFELPLQFRATTKFVSRRLPSAGRDDRAYRAYRLYESAKSDITVKNQVTNLRLSSTVHDVICEGDRKGIQFYTNDMPMRRADLDLLTIPGDPLAMLALMPSEAVEVGDTWTISEWAGQMFAGIEAATKVSLEGSLKSVNDQTATIGIQGEITGATTGAATTINVVVEVKFDLANRYITSCRIEQNEKRSVSTVTPGMEVKAVSTWSRAVAPANLLPETKLSGIPFDPPPVAKLLSFQSKHWKLRLIHDRNWYVFQELPEVAVLRLVENGSLISQCNIAQIAAAPAGEHVPAEKFIRDIQLSLGDQFSDIVDQQEIQAPNGNYIHRVVASGSANGLNMLWVYYLCAAPDGRQVSFVFAVEGENMEALQGRDLSMVESVEFLPK